MTQDNPLNNRSPYSFDPMHPRQPPSHALTHTEGRLASTAQPLGYGLDTRGLDPMNPQHVRHWQECQEWQHQVALEALRSQRLADVQAHAFAQQEALRLQHEQLMDVLAAKTRADQDATLERMQHWEDELMKRVDSALNSV